MVTDKNKEQFEKWYFTKSYYVMFDQLPFEMQIGVYLAYYDSLEGNKYIADYDINMCSWFVWIISKGNRVKMLRNDDDKVLWFKSRKSAEISMLEKANELINKI